MTATTLADRALLRLSGDDVRGFLQGLVTNDVSGRLPVWTALLTPQGKVLFDFLVWPLGEHVLIDCEASRAEALAGRLAIYRLRRPISIEPMPDLAVHWLLGPPTTGQFNDAVRDGVWPPMDPDPRLAALGRRWLARPGSTFADNVWRAHRLALGVTEGISELGDGDTLWLECNARELNGVSFAKGCYVGQENTARMHHRGKVNRRLVVVADSEDGERVRARYPALGLAVALRRTETLDAETLPAWLAEALAGDQRPTAI